MSDVVDKHFCSVRGCDCVSQLTMAVVRLRERLESERDRSLRFERLYRLSQAQMENIGFLYEPSKVDIVARLLEEE